MSRLPDDLPEDPDDRNEAQREHQGAHVGDGQPIDQGVHQAQPEEARRPEGRHRIGLPGELSNDHEGRERRKTFHGVEIGAVSPRTPQRNRTRRRIDIVWGLEKAIGRHLADDVGDPSAAVRMAV